MSEVEVEEQTSVVMTELAQAKGQLETAFTRALEIGQKLKGSRTSSEE